MTKTTKSGALKKSLLVSSTALVLGSVSLAHAQEDRRFGATDEIVVTANKRAENVQDVSASITALDSSSLDIAGITDATRLGLVVPGLQVGYSGTDARLAIRGSRTNNIGMEADQVVGVFEDGVYLPITTAVIGNYLDVERIEVLRGPQGTLYGRNTFGGAINVISKEPNFDQFEGDIEVTMGDYNTANIESVINVPVSDSFAVRIASAQNSHDGYIQNSYRPGPQDDLNSLDSQLARITARWDLNNADITLRYTNSTKDSTGTAIWGYTQIGCYKNASGQSTTTGYGATSTFSDGHCYQPGPNANPSNRAIPATTQDAGPWSVRRNSPSIVDTDNQSINLQISYDLGGMTLKYIGANTQFDSILGYDADYTDGSHGGDDQNVGFYGSVSELTSTSHEFQLLSAEGDALEWIVGAYLFNSENSWDWASLTDGAVSAYDSALSQAFETDASAFFANATYSLNDRTRLNAGLRSNTDEKTPKGGTSTSWDNTTYKLAAEYDAASDAMFYASVSTGYRVGGTNSAANVEQGAPATYDAEEVTALEFGVKSTQLDGDLTLNAALFSNSYTNMHAQSFVEVCSTPNDASTCIASEFTENGGEIDASGLELEFKWLPDGSPFFLNGTASFQQSEFGEYNVARVTGLGNLNGRQDVTQSEAELLAANASPQLSLKGYTPALNPEFSASLQAGYVFDIGNGNYVTPIIQSHISDEYWGFDINVAGSQQDSYTKTDLRIGWTNEARKLDVEAFVLNIEDEAVLTRAIVFRPGQADADTAEVASIQANYGDPQTWGVRMKVQF